MSTDPLAAIRVTFFQECEEQMGALEEGLMTMEEGDTSSETVNAVFRAVHSIKGGAGAFKLTELVAFAHTFETTLDLIRSNQLAAEQDIMKLLLRSADVLSDLVAQSRDGEAIDPSSYAGLAAELEAVVEAAKSGEAEDDFAGLDFTPTIISIDAPVVEDGPLDYAIRFRPHSALYQKANEPIALLRELSTLGVMSCQCDTSALPPLDAFDPVGSYITFNIQLTTKEPVEKIKEVFEFVDGDCDLDITCLSAPAASMGMPDMPSAPSMLATPYVPSAPIVQETAEVVELAKPYVPATPAPATAPAAAAPAEASGAAAGEKALAKSGSVATIRVDLDRVDRLINLVGELVINQAMLSMRIGQAGVALTAHVGSSMEDLERLTRDIQESVMAIRAQPVKALFQRMSRIVREVADSTGKNVRLKTDGEATEVDKTVVELLADPLTHMIRNAVDHGLESPADRLAAGKPEEGVVRLAAAHRSGRVMITISDDGAGINRPKVLEIAKRKELIPADAVLTDSEIDNLLFLPGFSTATTVSSISGRGVGMDVVKRSIQALGGRISIASTPGQGSTFTLSLPLTLAVLDGIVVSCAQQTFVIPLTSVVETLQMEQSTLLPMGQGTHAMRVRESFVPLIDIGLELGIDKMAHSINSGVAILVEGDSHMRCALLVDEIQDQRQVVIKSLENNYGRVPGVAAATILGDGRVAMILDVDGIIGGRGRETLLSQAS